MIINPPSASDIAMQIIYKTIWDKVPKKSFISKLWLRSYSRTSLWGNCFCHILPIDKYKYFKFYFGNIILVTPYEHSLWTQSSDEERIHYALSIEENSRGKATANWDAVEELRRGLELLYKKHFPVTYNGIVGYNYSLNEQQTIIGKLNKEFWRDFRK